MARVLNLKRADELEAGDIIAVNRSYRKWMGREVVGNWTERDYRWLGDGVEYGDDVLKLVHSVRVIGDDAEMMLSPVDKPDAKPSDTTCSVGWEYDVVGSMEVPHRYLYSYWWGEGWVEGTEESISSDTPLSNDDINRIAKERGHFPVTYIHEYGPYAKLSLGVEMCCAEDTE